jgi:hypothetical protein
VEAGARCAQVIDPPALRADGRRALLHAVVGLLRPWRVGAVTVRTRAAAIA